MHIFFKEKFSIQDKIYKSLVFFQNSHYIMEIHPKAKEVFNKAAQDLISLITEIKFPERPKDETALSSSYKELPILDLNQLGAKLDILYSHNSDTGELCQICKFTEKGVFGISENNIDKFSALVNNIYKKTDWIANATLLKLVFQFIIDARFVKTEKTLTDFLDEWRTKNAKTFNFYFIIKGMSIETPFLVGNVAISYNNRQAFENLFNELTTHPQEWEKENIQKKFVGNTIAICGIQNCELEKAKEIAIATCSRSIDAIKIFSDVINYPNRAVAFDLDYRFIEEGRENNYLTLVFDTENATTPSYLTRGWGSNDKNPQIFEIRKSNLKEFELYGFAYIHTLLIRKDKNETCEIEDIALEALFRFASALSNKDLHIRITEIFTSLESLVLRNSEVGILESLCKYIPKIIAKDSEERLKVQKGLKSMYAVRSAYMHHGKRLEIDFKELKMLQIYLRSLILKFCMLSSEHKTKNSILDAIDDAINKAF